MAIKEKLLETHEFATLPPVASRVLTLLEDDEIDIRDLSSIIETDASLTLKLLQVANSPLYASRQEITSIHQAIINLGLNRLTNIVIGVSIFSNFLVSSQKHAKNLMEKFWWHSSCTGTVAKSLTSKISKGFKEMEFIGGLLHKIGKLSMIQYDSEQYYEVIKLITADEYTDVDAEKKIFGIDHVEVGTEIAKIWRLPEELKMVISYYTYPSQAPKYKELVSVVRLSDLLSELWGAGFFEGIEKLELKQEESWQVLCDYYPELKELDVEAFTYQLEEEFKNAADFLNILVSS